MTVLQGAHDFVVNGNSSLEVENSWAFKTGSGLEALLKASYPNPAQDASARPAQSYPGLCRQHIEDITEWAWMLATERHFRMMWLRGPAGVGKSALAQSCVKEVGTKLAAAFFFSRLNARDDPARLFTSIAYQLSTRYPLYCDKLDEKLYQDCSLLQKSIDIQFQELIVAPFQELQREGKRTAEGVIFIDGLDECAGEDAQCTIVDVISASVRDRTTPFIWAVLSRPEPQIVAQFSAPHVYPLCWQLNLPLSREADGEIKLYLQGAFQSTQTQYDIPSTAKWPSDGDIQELVDRSGGSFIYPTSLIRYVNTTGALGPEERLRQVLRHRGKSASNPWTHLDAFYTLVMEQVSKEMLPITLKLLLSFQVVDSQSPSVAAAILGLSMSTFSAALGELHPVLKLVRSDDGQPRDVKFYHASFKDFLGDPERSKIFYLRTPERCGELLVDMILFFDEGPDRVIVPWHDPRLVDDMKRRLESAAFDILWQLGSYAAFDEALLQRLSEFDFRKLLYGWKIRQEDAERFFNNIPAGWKKIIRPYSSLLSRILFRKNKQAGFPFVLGNGKRRIILENVGHIHLIDYEDFKQIERYNLVWSNLIWRPLRHLIHRINTVGEIEQY